MENKTKYFVATLDYIALARIFLYSCKDYYEYELKEDKTNTLISLVSKETRKHACYITTGNLFQKFQTLHIDTGHLKFDPQLKAHISGKLKLSLFDYTHIKGACELLLSPKYFMETQDVDMIKQESGLKFFEVDGTKYLTYENLETPTVLSSQIPK